MTHAPRLPYVLIAPSAIFLVLLFVWPLAETALMAFFRPDGTFTWDYLVKGVGDIYFLPALKNTLWLVAIIVPVQVIVALAMAVLLSKLEKGRSIFLYIWTIPLGVSDLAAGLAWLAILDSRGYMNSALFALGVIDNPTTWLSYQTPIALFIGVIVAEVWRATAIVLVILVSGMQLIPKEYDEAAQVFGASPWQRFWRITLPLLKPSLQSALILRTVLAFEVFAVVYALAGRDLPVLVAQAYAWQGAYQNTHVASVLALLILILSIGVTLIYLRLLRVKREVLS
jgi:multiple sugar transport system permease protein